MPISVQDHLFFYVYRQNYQMESVNRMQVVVVYIVEMGPVGYIELLVVTNLELTYFVI